MNISKSKFNIVVTGEDLDQMRNAIRFWKEDQSIADEFDGSKLYDHYERWSQFVETDWDGWDISEYNHDIGCRYWIQMAIEYSTHATVRRLENEVAKVDKIFFRKMTGITSQNMNHLQSKIFKEQLYFWECNTIYST